MGDYYNLLEVPRNVPPEESRRVYRQLALRRRSDKNPDYMAEAEARFMNISGAYEVFPSESKRPEYDFHRRGGKDTGHQADFVRSQDATAYNTDGASTFTHRDRDQLFREFFGSWDPFEAVFHGMHGGQCGPTVLTGGFPLYQQNSASTYLTDFLFDSDNLARLLSASGVGGSSAAVVAMQTHQASSLRYVNGRGIETRTIIRDGLMNTVCFEDGQLVSQTIERAVHERTPDASPVHSREFPPCGNRGNAPDICVPYNFGGCVSTKPSSATKGVYRGNSGPRSPEASVPE